MWIYGPTFNFNCYSLILMISLKLLNSHIPILRALIISSRSCYYLDDHIHSANTRLFSPHSSEFYTFSGFFFSCWVCVFNMTRSPWWGGIKCWSRGSQILVCRRVTCEVCLVCRLQGPTLQTSRFLAWVKPGNLHSVQLSGDSDAGGPRTTTGKLKTREDKALIQSPAPEPQPTSLAPLSGSNEIINGKGLWKVFSTL